MQPTNILALVLPVIAGAVWAPQLLKSPHAPHFEEDDDTPAELEFAETDLAQVSEWAAEESPKADSHPVKPSTDHSVVASEITDEANEVVPPPPLEASTAGSTTPTSNPLLASLDSSLGALQQLKKRRPNLGDMFKEPDSSAAAGEPALESVVAIRPTLRSLEPEQVLARWASSRRLTGVVYGAGVGMAMLDDQIVEAGWVFAGGVRVERVGPRWVEVGFGGAAHRIELQTYRPPAPTSDEDGDEAPSDDQQSDETGSSLPQELLGQELLGGGSLTAESLNTLLERNSALATQLANVETTTEIVDQ